ncbi:outer membrane protein transport protein [Algicola sagamiensis]|uniref:outer membrane protein transport protein n=1 Tax=Algicola sagamiensis TaxID=163869 RepID=UPI0003738A87|nr:outer membrane protein transport protein [Algicola sagamiensis]
MKKLSCISLALLSTGAMSAGFQANEHGAAGLGRAFAGEAAVADNASVLARNSAAMSVFDRTVISGGLSYVNPEVEVRGTSTLTRKEVLGLLQGANSKYGIPIAIEQLEYNANANDIAPDQIVPNFYIIHPVSDKIAVGFAANTYYGLATSYDSNFNASDLADEADIKSINLSPNISYKVTPEFSIGGGLNIVQLEGEFQVTSPWYAGQKGQILKNYIGNCKARSKNVDLIGCLKFNQKAGAALGNSSLTKLLDKNANMLSVKGDDISLGWNIGLIYQTTEALRLGASYRSDVDFTLKGEAKSELPNLQGTGSLDITLPAMAEFSAYHEVTQSWAWSASAVWTNWSEFDKLTMVYNDKSKGARGNGRQLLQENKWKDAWRYSIGLTHQLNSDITLRTGVALDKSPVDDKYRNLSIPDSDRTWYSFGGTYQIDPDMSVDVGYTFVDGDKEKIKQTKSSAFSTFEGTAEGDAHIFAASFNYRF